MRTQAMGEPIHTSSVTPLKRFGIHQFSSIKVNTYFHVCQGTFFVCQGAFPGCEGTLHGSQGVFPGYKGDCWGVIEHLLGSRKLFMGANNPFLANIGIQVIYITCSWQVFVFPILQSPPDVAQIFWTCQLHTAWQLLQDNGAPTFKGGVYRASGFTRPCDAGTGWILLQDCLWDGEEQHSAVVERPS